MKIIRNIIKFLDKIVNLIVIVFFICAIAFSGYAIYDAYQVYDNANLSAEIMKYKTRKEKDFSLADLQNINEDICGWIRIDNTNIDYPIVVGKDNSEYLSLNYKKEFSAAGSIFLDYRNSKDMADDYMVLYGHNMKSNQMFSDIKKYENKSFFDKSQSGTLYTSEGIFNIDVFGYEKVNAFSDNVYNVISYKNGKNKELIDYFMKDSINSKYVEFNNEDRILLLSTCDIVGGATRAVLICKISKSSVDSNIINKDKVKNNEQVELTTATQIELQKIKLKFNMIFIIIGVLFICFITLYIIIKKLKIGIQ